MAKSEDSPTVSETLRAAMCDSGLSARELGRRAGVNHGVLSRFLKSERTMTLPLVDALAKALGLQLTKRRQKG